VAVRVAAARAVVPTALVVELAVVLEAETNSL
jgi:hypothetical protein